MLFSEEKYDYSKFEFKTMKDEVTITCPTHGDFERTPSSMLQYETGCHQCSREEMYGRNTLTTEQYLSRANEIHNSYYLYDDTKYTNMKSSITYICPSHGLVTQLASCHLTSGCLKCSLEEATWTTETFISKARGIHGFKYNYPYVDY